VFHHEQPHSSWCRPPSKANPWCGAFNLRKRSRCLGCATFARHCLLPISVSFSLLGQHLLLLLHPSSDNIKPVACLVLVWLLMTQHLACTSDAVMMASSNFLVNENKKVCRARVLSLLTFLFGVPQRLQNGVLPLCKINSYFVVYPEVLTQAHAALACAHLDLLRDVFSWEKKRTMMIWGCCSACKVSSYKSELDRYVECCHRLSAGARWKQRAVPLDDDNICEVCLALPPPKHLVSPRCC